MILTFRIKKKSVKAKIESSKTAKTFLIFIVSIFIKLKIKTKKNQFLQQTQIFILLIYI